MNRTEALAQRCGRNDRWGGLADDQWRRVTRELFGDHHKIRGRLLTSQECRLREKLIDMAKESSTFPPDEIWY